MVITQISIQKRNKERWNIYIDSSFSFSASAEDIVRYGLKEGKKIDEDELQRLTEACEYTKAYNYALSILNIRDYTCSALKKKLMDKGYSEGTSNIVMEKLGLYGIIDDERYVTKYVNDCVRLKKYGRNKIMYDLQSKGISDELKKSIIIDEELQYNNCLELGEKKLRQLQGKDKIKEKLYRHLVTKGYPYEIIVKVINQLVKDERRDME
jgi:regulatory protein